MYRILTQNANVDTIRKCLIDLGIDYTMFWGEGCWKGTPEPSLVIETLTTNLDVLKRAAEWIGTYNLQQAVFIQYIPDTLYVYDVQKDKWTDNSKQSAFMSTEDKSTFSRRPNQTPTEKE